MSIPRLSQNMINNMTQQELQTFVNGLKVFNQVELVKNDPNLKKTIDSVNTTLTAISV